MRLPATRRSFATRCCGRSARWSWTPPSRRRSADSASGDPRRLDRTRGPCLRSWRRRGRFDASSRSRADGERTIPAADSSPGRSRTRSRPRRCSRRFASRRSSEACTSSTSARRATGRLSASRPPTSEASAGRAREHGRDAAAGSRVEEALAGGASAADAADRAAEGTEPPADISATSEYRAHLARVLVRRALGQL